MKRIRSLGFAAVLFAIATLVIPSASVGTAHAAVLTDTTHCSSLGTLIEADNIMDGSTILGYLNVYYNSSNGYNCAETTSASATYGVQKRMEVEIYACNDTVPGNGCTTMASDSDSGNYYYYAGPAGVHAPGHCIHAAGDIIWNGVDYFANTNPLVGHCGS
jgi:hypothetical protein